LLPDADAITTSFQYFVCYITHAFQLQRHMFNTALNNVQPVHPFTSCVHVSKYATCQSGHFKHVLN